MTDKPFDAKAARAKRPLPLWVDALLRDTALLEPDEFGCYMKILIAMWSSRDVALPNNPRKLARAAGVSLSMWNRRIGPALEGYFTVEGDNLVQKRLILEAQFVEQAISKQSNKRRGKNSAKPLKNNDPDKSTDTPADNTTDKPPDKSEDDPQTNPSQQPNNPIDNNSEDKSSSLLSARARDDDDHPDLYLDFLAAHPRPRETARGGEAWTAALASGQSADDLIAAATRYSDASSSFDRDKVQYSDNWLSDQSWKRYPPVKMQAALTQSEREQHRRDRQVEMIKGGNPSVCAHISAFAAEELVAMDLVTEAECRAVGVL